MNVVIKIRSLFPVNIHYLEFNPEKEKYGGDIYIKWAKAISHSNTKYTQICTDKEFFIPTSLVKCISYLEVNKEYIASMGIWYQIHPAKTDNGEYLLRKLEMSGFKGESNSVSERYLDSYIYPQLGVKGLLHSLSRTDYLSDLYDSYLEIPNIDIRYGELYLTSSGYLYGKVKYFEDIYKLRDSIGIQEDIKKSKSHMCNSKESSFTRYPPLTDYSNLPETREFYDNFITATKQLTDNLNIKHDDKTKIIDTLPLTPIIRSAHSKLKVKAKLTDIYSVFDTPRKIWARMPQGIQHTISIIINKIFHIPLAEIRVEDTPITYIKEAELIDSVIRGIYYMIEY